MATIVELVGFLNEQINDILSNNFDSNLNYKLKIRLYRELIAFATIYSDKINQIYYDNNLLYDKKDDIEQFKKRIELDSFFNCESIKINAFFKFGLDDPECETDENEDEDDLEICFDDPIDNSSFLFNITLNSKYLSTQPAIIQIEQSSIGSYKTKELLQLLNYYCNENIGSEILCKIFVDIPKFLHILQNVSLEHCLLKTGKSNNIPANSNTSLTYSFGQLSFLDKFCDLDLITLKNSKAKIDLALNNDYKENIDSTILPNTFDYLSSNIHWSFNFFNKKIKNVVNFEFGSIKMKCSVYNYEANRKNEQSTYRVNIFDYDFSSIDSDYYYSNFTKIIIKLQSFINEIFISKYNNSGAVQKFFPAYIAIDTMQKQDKHFIVITIQESFDGFFPLRHYQSILSITKNPIALNQITFALIQNIQNCLNHLEYIKFFHGNMNLDNIFINSTGELKLFDMYIEPFLLVIAPFLMEKFLDKPDYIKFINDPEQLFNHNCYVELFKLMVNTDVFNFGSLLITFLIDIDFTPFLTYFTNEQIQMNVMLKIFNRLSAFKYHDKLKKIIDYCLSVKKHKSFGEIPFDPFQSEMKLFIKKENINLIENIVEIVQLNNLNVNEIRSRLANDFEIIKRLGRGGFGSVLEVFNKFDRSLYAVKVVHFDSDSESQVLREVKLLSKLNHPNVVRYYSSWLDDYDIVQNIVSDSSSENTNEYNQYFVEYSSKAVNVKKFKNINESEDESIDESKYYNPDESKNDIEDDSEDNNNDNEDKSQNGRNFTLNRKETLKGPVLCILMELCKEKTLDDLINNDEIQDKQMCYNIFRDITSALAYIHENKIMHRDLKPKNILVGLNSHVKLGDFGLSRTISANKPLLNEELELPVYLDQKKLSDMTLNIGTFFYMAPELRKRESKRYSNKVDIYSLGLIFLEMCYKFSTHFEKIQVFNCIAETGELPRDISNMLEPIELELISGMCNLDINKRLSANEILQIPLIKMSFNESNIKNYDTHSLINILSKDSDLLQKFLRNVMHNSSESKMTSKFNNYLIHSSFNLSQFIFQSISLFYCAINFAELSLFPVTWWHKVTENNIANVIDSKGQFLSLPHFNKYSFAYQTSSDTSKYFMRRIFIGPAFIDSKENFFKEYSNASFDIVWPKMYSTSTLLSYIEINSFTIDLLLFFIAPSKDFIFNINQEFKINDALNFDSNTKIIFTMNNLKLLSYICEILEIPTKDYTILIKHIILYNQSSHSNRTLKEYIQFARRTEIFLNISEQKSNILFELLNISTNDVDVFTERISSILDRLSYITESSKNDIQSQLDYQKMLTKSIEYYYNLKNYRNKFLDYFGVRFSLSSIKQNYQFYNGIITYITLERKNDSKLLAVAGNFSHLIQEEIINSENINHLSKFAIGISFNLNYLNRMMLGNFGYNEYLSAEKYIRLLTNRFRTLESGNVNFKLSFIDMFVVPVFNELNLNSIHLTLNFVYQLRELGISVLLTPERIINSDFVPTNLGPSELIFDAAKNQFSKFVIFLEIKSGNIKFHCFNQISPRHSGKNSGWELKTLNDETEVIDYVLNLLKYRRRSSCSPHLIRSNSVQSSTSNYQIEFVQSGKFDRRKMNSLIEKQLKNYFANNQNMLVIAVDYPYEMIKMITFYFDIDKLAERLDVKNIQSEMISIEQELLKELARINGSKHYQDSITRTVKLICNYVVTSSKNRSNNNLMILLMAINEHYKFAIIT